MTRRLRVAPGPGHTLHLAAETIHITPVPTPAAPTPHATADPIVPSSPSPSPPSDPVWVRPRGRIDVHVTLVAPSASTFDGAALVDAPRFESLDHLTTALTDRAVISPVHGHVYARVKAASPVSMDDIDKALSVLPKDVDLTLALDPADG